MLNREICSFKPVCILNSEKIVNQDVSYPKRKCYALSVLSCLTVWTLVWFLTVISVVGEFRKHAFEVTHFCGEPDFCDNNKVRLLF